MNIKKIVSIILVIAMTLSIFGGCGQTQKTDTPQANLSNRANVQNLAETVNEIVVVNINPQFRNTEITLKVGQKIQYLFTDIYLSTFYTPSENEGYGTLFFSVYYSKNDFLEFGYDYVHSSTYQTVGGDKYYLSESLLTPIFSKVGKYTISGSYYVSNNLEQMFSITVNVIAPPPTIDVPTQPTSQEIMQGENKNLSVSANLVDGTGAISYQWYNGTTAISGATSSSYNLSTLAVGTHKLKCKLSATNAIDVYTTEVTIKVLAKPLITITTQPISKEFFVGQTESVSVTANIANKQADISYQWYDGETAINGATSATLNLSSMGIGTHKLKCVLTSLKADTKTTSIAIVVIKYRPTIVITEQPKDTTITVGESVTIGVGAYVTDENVLLNYEWLFNNEIVKDVNSKILSLEDLPKGTYTVNCKLTADGYDEVNSDVATVVVEDKTTEPTEDNIFQKILTSIVNFFQSIIDWIINLFN